VNGPLAKIDRWRPAPHLGISFNPYGPAKELNRWLVYGLVAEKTRVSKKTEGLKKNSFHTSNNENM
jgi:hypothetical protein